MTRSAHSQLLATFLGALLATPACHNGADPAAKNAPGRVVTVRTAAVARQDVPVTLTGLGSVNAFYTVTVHPQVDGRIDEVLFREGEQVEKGRLLLRIDPRQFKIALQNAEAALARDRATLKNNQLNLQRYTRLRADKLIAEQNVTDQQALVGQLQGTVLADEAQVDQARLQLDYAHVKAPIDGVTGLRLVDPGNVVHASDTNGLLVITQLDPISVLFTLPEDALPAVAKGMAAGTLVAEAFARDGTTHLADGNLTLIDNQINASSGTLRLKAVFANPQHALWPNQFVKIRLRLQTLAQALVVPAEAVLTNAEGTFVFIADPNHVARRRPVVVERYADSWAVLTQGVQVGDQVLVEGQHQVQPDGAIVLLPVEAASKAAP